MKKYFIVSTILILSFAFSTFAQLDSVFYLGPAAGSVPSGVMVTLNPLTFDAPADGKRIADRITEDPYFNPSPQDLQATNLPEYVYVEDTPVSGLNKGIDPQTIILNKWEGIPMTNSIPPDGIMAVGPDHVIACVNSMFRVWDKEGNLLASVSADGWISPVISSGAFDPQIIYDHYSNRWFMLWDWQNSGTQEAYFIISYSDNADPFGTWYMYRMDARVNGTTNSGTWGDFPQIGYDDEAIYINSRSFTFAGSYLYNRIRIVNKSQLYASNGGTLPFVDLWSIGRPSVPSDKPDVLEPAKCYTPGQGGYFFNTLQNGGVYYIVYRMLNPISASPRLRGKTIVTTTYGGAPLAQQLGGGMGIESGGSKCRHSPIVRNGFLYAAHSIANTTNSTYSSIRYNILELTSATIVEQSELGAIGYYHLYPALAIDKDNNIAVTFSRSATTEYAGAFFSSKYATDPPGLNPSTPLQVGLGNYVVDFGSGRNRWGDYMGIDLDMTNEYDVWTFTEFAKATNTWSTMVGRIRMAAYPGAHAYPIPGSIDFSEIEIGTESQTESIILANYGDADLIITNIPSTFDDFNLISVLSFPLTLASYDSVTLEFSFSPTTEGTAIIVYPVSSNDSQFAGFPLSGTGYEIELAAEKTFYASSGSQNNGDILTINPVTGFGTNIGSSSFSEVSSIAISPVDGKIYGLVAGSGSSDIVKVNAAEGDAHLIFTLSIPLMTSIAFDTSGTLYGITRTGDFYTIDENLGTSSFVVDAVGSYYGITFHPQTNELWATSRAIVGVNVDAISKVNISTGDTSIVGHTGLGKQTNSIAFDENLNLFGVIGSNSQVSDFVSINTTTGSGTIVGSIGLSNVISLAYISDVVSGVDDEINGTIPSDYVLMQNYPNPFNPTTKIEFSLPMESQVRLIIFNILGQEVIRLVDGQMTAGTHSVVWNANDEGLNKITSGIYLYKLTASGINGNEFQDIKKMILMK
ncbi:MAG: T9SS type A sorting domain-containing protein [Nitrososphaerales archaeon]